EKIVKFLPFFGNLDDLDSDSPNKKIAAIFGLFTDSVSFLLPIGKFVSGTVKLASTSVRMGFKNTLPKFSSLSRELLVASLQNFNPLDGLPTLAKAAVRGLYAANTFVLKAAIRNIERLVMRTGKYDFVKGLPQVTDPGRYKLLSATDDLASVKGLDDVPVRKIASTQPPHYRLIDPISGKPYGPSLATHSDELALGRSAYRPLEKTDQHTIVEVAENAKVREVLEVDGRTTMFIDDVAYQLDTDMLRRADKIDIGDRLKALPCRVRRESNAVCATIFVTAIPAAPPFPANRFDETKGWALWFGDAIYTPANGRAPMEVASFANRNNLNATMEFRKGIYGRVKINVPEQGLDDTFQVGAIICGSMDRSKQYVFTRLNAGDFYVAELAKGQSLREALTFKQASTLAPGLKDELVTVYTGSLNANNMARIHGIDKVEHAIKAMDEIAIPIGSHLNPPDTLKLIKVDTTPAEAALFDHSTRMIIRSSTDGAATWSLSRNAPDSVRETTAEVFNALFKRTVITVDSTQTGAKALKIDDTMRQLQKIISKKLRRPLNNRRNIAFAEIKTKSGVREIYVSVSGSKGDTGFLPMFEKPANRKEVTVASTRYFNIDSRTWFPETALNVTPENKLLAIPHTIEDIETYTPALTLRPTSLDTESKLISVIRTKYPDPKVLDSITIATTMAPCDSCSIVMKQFGYDGSPNALDVIWK
ncbi:hypothetical protein HCU66_15995, partial [Pseudomonas frederiksbergensis]|uniref:deaminase domain-containing protein n=1 Tax=Pseudomonas frederiksbergensis TaxID=104087 RepID=UPI002402B484